MTFPDKRRYDRTFQKVTNKVGEYSINYIKIFSNAQDSSVSEENNYSENKLMPTFMDNFRQGGKYSAQAELRREEIFTDQKSLSVSSLQTDYLNLDCSSDCGRNSEKAKMFRQSALFVEVLITLQKKSQKDQKRKGKSLCGW